MASRPIAVIKEGDSAEPIEVRIIRKWQPFINKEEYCYLFVDKEGNAIEAITGKRDKPFIESKISLGSCYYITNYLSTKSRNKYNIVPHVATLRLGKGTTFAQVCDEDFPKFYFNFQSHSRLKDRLDMHFLLTDYIGVFNSIIVDKTTETGKKLLKFALEDDSGKLIEVALWEEIADTVDMKHLSAGPSPCIVVLTSMRVTEYNALQLTSTAATHVYINPNIDEAHTLSTRFKEKYGNVDIGNRNQITLADLNARSLTDSLTITFTCIASIASIDKTSHWFYVGCNKCLKKLTPKGTTLACISHPEETQPRYVYCVSVTLADNTDIATATLFDDAVMSLINIPCKQMVLERGYDNPEVIPELLYTATHITKAFHLRFNTRAHPESSRYIVYSITEGSRLMPDAPNASETPTSSETPASSTTGSAPQLIETSVFTPTTPSAKPKRKLSLQTAQASKKQTHSHP